MSDDVKLTKSQRAALNSFLDNDWKCSYSLGVRLDTLQALAGKGLLQKKAEPGYIFSPRTSILFRITEKGKSV